MMDIRAKKLHRTSVMSAADSKHVDYYRQLKISYGVNKKGLYLPDASRNHKLGAGGTVNDTASASRKKLSLLWIVLEKNILILLLSPWFQQK
jgi:hypothetical protein